MARQTTESGQSMIVYDDDLISHIDASLFEPAHWPDAVSATGPGGGRGGALFVDHNGQHWVLRHYFRGGLARRLSNDRFAWSGRERSRSFREWALLDEMYRAGLPVPRPVAARVVRHGTVYTADLVTVRIPDVQTLSARLSNTPLDSAGWRAIGDLIARFHTAGICHADLNAHNIQIDSRGHLFLLDFDRGRIMSGPGGWTRRNLERLRRSLDKLLDQGAIRFDDSNWTALLDGYRQTPA